MSSNRLYRSFFLVFIIVLLLPFVAGAQSTVTVSGDVKNVFTVNPGDTKVRVCFQLTDSVGNPVADPQIPGVGVLVADKNVCVSPTSGHWATAVYGNNVIRVNGVVGVTQYTVSYLLNNQFVKGDTFILNTTDSPVDLNTKVGLSTTPLVVPVPTDQIYARLDSGNQPFTDPIQAPSATFTGPVLVGGTLTSTVGTGSSIATAILNNDCITDFQVGADAGAKVNACIAGVAAGTYKGIFSSTGGTVSTQILINNLSHFKWTCHSTDGFGATNFVDGIVGNPAADEVLINGTSAYVTIEGCAFPGNALTGASGNGHGIAIKGTGATPAEINLINVDASGHKGNGTDGTSASLGAAGVYTYKAIDVRILQASSFQSNQFGFYADTGSNDFYMDGPIVSGNLTNAGKVLNTTTAHLDRMDIEGNSGPVVFDACVNCSLTRSHFEGQTVSDFTVNSAQGFSFNTIFAHNYLLHSANLSGYADFGTGAVSPLAEDNTCVVTTGGASAQCIRFESGVVDPKALRNHIFVSTGGTVLAGVVFAGNTSGGTVEGTTCGRTSASLDGTISRCVDLGTSTGATAKDTQCIANAGGVISFCVVTNLATAPRIENTTCNNLGGTISTCNLETASGSCFGQNCASTAAITAGSAGLGVKGATSGTSLLIAPTTGGVSNTLPSVAGTLVTTIASGTATMTTAAITGPNCGTTVTVAASGVLTTDTIIATDNAIPAATTNGPLTIKAWPTANNVNFAYCTPSGTITPAAATINWRVTR